MGVHVRRTWSAIIAIVAFNSVMTTASATEKYWIAHNAELIIIGQYHHGITYPWIDGWHVSGTLSVDEVLFGRTSTRQIKYQLVCRWQACQTWPPPPIAEWFGEKGIWFLRAIDGQSVAPPGNNGIDPGFRSLEQRADFENYILRYKR